MATVDAGSRTGTAGVMANGVTKAYGQRPWEELNVLLADVVPAEASEREAEDGVTAALAESAFSRNSVKV